MNEWIEEVHALADGELEGEAKERAMKLVETDEKAAAEYQWAVTLKQTVGSKCANTGYEEAWKACQARLDELDAVSSDSRVESFVGRFGWAIASVMLVVILAAGLLNRGNQQISDQQFASLFNGEAAFEQFDANSTQDVESNIGTKLPYVEPVVKILGAGQAEIEGTKVTRIDMLDNVGPISLIIFEDTKGVKGLEPIPSRSEYTGGQFNGAVVVSWPEGENVFSIIANRSVDEMVNIADKMRSEP